ncbi:MAG: FGGY family carbohydrate kinase [Eubacteriales bacterium]|nr:FGGY family carbohydrate kinase [Eubacteriales bacterium]
MCLLGLDIGTSGCKATIIDENGRVLSEAYREYALISERPGWQVLDPEQIWNAVVQVMSEAIQAKFCSRIRAIGVSSFGEATVAIDRNGRVLCNSMIYIDSRGALEAEALKERFGDQKILSITGTAIDPMYSLCKILWLKKNQPQIFADTWKFLLFADFILFKLGAEPATDYSLATRTMAFDITKKQWSVEILDAVGIAVDKFAQPVQSGTVIGKISLRYAHLFGLSQDVVLVAGGHDQACAALGAGVTQPGLAVDDLGTTECITPAFSKPILTKAMAANYYASVPHVIPDLFVTYAFSFTSGSVLKWYRDTFGDSFKAAALKQNRNAYELLIESASPTPASVLVVPHFAGAATPYMDHAAVGAIIGLTINTKPEDIMKGILEGITFEIMVNVERLAEAGIAINELRAVGGLAKSAAFLQLKATMMGIPVTTLAVPEAGTLGVAILAGTACGLYPSLAEAVKQLVHTEKTYYPDPILHQYYQKRFVQYKKLYPALRALRDTDQHFQ